MKKLILFTFISISNFCFSQTKEDLFELIDKFNFDEKGKIYFSFVDTINEKSKSELHFLAHSYFVDNFKSSNDVIQMNDSAKGVIAGRENFDISYSLKIMRQEVFYNAYSSFFLKIQSRENRYKVDITNFEYNLSVLNVDTNYSMEKIMDKNMYDDKMYEPTIKSSYLILSQVYSFITQMQNDIKNI